jgi:pimeloyl-ACP methyl ester carboxylesterase
MLQVYREGQSASIPQMKVERGIAVMLEKPEDVDDLLALCELAPRPPKSPMQGLYDCLTDEALNAAEWGSQWKYLGYGDSERRRDIWLQDAFGQGASASTLPLLMDALRLSRALWHAEPDDPKHSLRLVVTIGNPSRGGEIVVSAGVKTAALAFKQGSLVADILKLPFKAIAFGVLFVQGGGVTPSARSSEFVDRLRGRASQAGPVDLDRLEWLDSAKLDDKPLVVLIHGLLGTDVGTFGKLEEALRRGPRPFVAGFPHDSLTHSVDKNADDLLKLLLPLGNRPIALVCHSRGGLVARAAAVKNAGAKQKLDLRAIATFGSPHNGTAIAEATGGMALVPLLGQAAKKTASVASIGDVLSCYLTDEKFPGVTDLKPVRENTEYVYKLKQQEAALADEDLRPILTVGGVAKSTGAWAWLSKRIIGDKDSDLVVEISSSVPSAEGFTQTDDCDHFSYFKDERRIRYAEEFIRTHLR